MRARIVLSTLYTTLILTGCIHVDRPPLPETEFTYDERDFIPSDVPLPKPEVNQRPNVGTKTMLVTVTHWQDGSLLNYELVKKHTLSPDPDSLQSYVSAASGGKMTLTGQVIQHTSGPMPEICKTGSPMPINLAAEEGHKAARANGLDADTFDFVISVIQCGGNASAWKPGRFIGVYGQPGSPHVYKHEFGHSLGYSHGTTFTQCPRAGDTVTAPTGCTPISYGDTGDSVSGGGTLYPANNRWYSAWLDNAQTAVITQSGLYRLTKLGAPGAQLYLINRPGLKPAQLAMEFRAPTPFDHFPVDDNRVNGVWIRYTTMAASVDNTQVDGTPETSSTADPTFVGGKRFRDDETGTTIEVCSAINSGAVVAVSVGSTLTRCASALSAPTIRVPAAGAAPVSSPVVFSGTSRPGALINLSYRVAGSSNWKDIKVSADAHGNWAATLPELISGKYNAQAWQTMGSSASLATFRNFEVVP
ncbi:metallopeptidase domain-containing protein [Pseudomonas sp. S2_C03]